MHLMMAMDTSLALALARIKRITSFTLNNSTITTPTAIRLSVLFFLQKQNI
jgi:plasmid maintenance system antidote protein VapI